MCADIHPQRAHIRVTAAASSPRDWSTLRPDHLLQVSLQGQPTSSTHKLWVHNNVKLCAKLGRQHADTWAITNLARSQSLPIAVM